MQLPIVRLFVEDLRFFSEFTGYKNLLTEVYLLED
jgi:hypothetical protein